ncbi:hypothetical protein [Pseudochelatococcus contaminans]|uniref:Uncharacterized protein n=1 Tax=Pseudochelatococcus contaminans TaxID=1538103 RepID=A0A7W5Z3T9_9HYPH|nr:hypothetical protein [Pseudochelatococcus contaminans]MBB3809237.1 hypothetical protein [Pseudochelatococcus contaminans]
MVRAVIIMAVSLTAFPVFAAGPAGQSRGQDDSFLHAAPPSGGGRVPNYVADSAKGQPFDQNDRRRFERPYLSGESTGLKVPTR